MSGLCLLFVGKAFYPGLDLGPDLLVHMHGEQGGKARRLQDKRDRNSWRYTLPYFYLSFNRLRILILLVCTMFRRIAYKCCVFYDRLLNWMFIKNTQ